MFNNERFAHDTEPCEDYYLSLFQSTDSLKLPDDWCQSDPIAYIADDAPNELPAPLPPAQFEGLALPGGLVEAQQQAARARQSQSGASHTLGSASYAGASGPYVPSQLASTHALSHQPPQTPVCGMTLRQRKATPAASYPDEGATDADADTQDHCPEPGLPAHALPPPRKSRKKEVVDLATITDPEEYRRQKKLQKNRRTAAASRQRKRMHMEHMESAIQRLESQLSAMQALVAAKDSTIQQLQSELTMLNRATTRPPPPLDAPFFGPTETTVFFSVAISIYVLAWRKRGKRVMEKCLGWSVLTDERFAKARVHLQRLLHDLPEDITAAHLGGVKERMQLLPPDQTTAIWQNVRHILRMVQCCDAKRDPCSDESQDPSYLRGFPINP